MSREINCQGHVSLSYSEDVGGDNQDRVLHIAYFDIFCAYRYVLFARVACPPLPVSCSCVRSCVRPLQGEGTIPQHLLRKYIMYARNNVRPQLHNIDQDKVGTSPYLTTSGGVFLASVAADTATVSCRLCVRCCQTEICASPSCRGILMGLEFSCCSRMFSYGRIG